MGVTLIVLTHACIFILIEKFLWNVKKLILFIYQLISYVLVQECAHVTQILHTRPSLTRQKAVRWGTTTTRLSGLWHNLKHSSIGFKLTSQSI